MKRLKLALCVVATACFLAACSPGDTRMDFDPEAPGLSDGTIVEYITPTPSPTPTPTPVPTPTPPPEPIVISMVGDCTLSSSQRENEFDKVMGDDYSYPFFMVEEIFEKDDFTIINLENSFSDEKLYGSDPFLFRAPAAYAKILTEGNVELATMGNNHTNEFGKKGVENTKAALDAEGILHLHDNTGAIYEIRGMKLGVFVSKYLPSAEMVRKGVSALKADGADFIIACIHWGVEGRYRQVDTQEAVGRAAINAGADIVCGTHPHVLQPVEEYNGGHIMYSLGNFSFGGNTKPRDMDSAIAQAVIEESPDGGYVLKELKFIPVSISGESKKNNFQPVLVEEGSEEYERVMSKLDGTFKGPNLSVDYSNLS